MEQKVSTPSSFAMSTTPPNQFPSQKNKVAPIKMRFKTNLELILQHKLRTVYFHVFIICFLFATWNLPAAGKLAR